MATPQGETTEKHDVDAMSDRHDEIREQLALMDAWVEDMPTTNAEERRVGMQRIVATTTIEKLRLRRSRSSSFSMTRSSV